MSKRGKRKSSEAIPVAPAAPVAAAGISRNTLILAILLLLAAIIPELPAVNGAFQWDDEWHIVTNRNLVDAAGLGRAWAEPESNLAQNYYPLTITIFWVEYQLFGLASTVPFHMMNLLFHGVVVILLWRLLVNLKAPWAFLVALLFAMHPMVVDSVAYISELKTLLSSGLYIAAILLYLRWRERGSWHAFAWMIIAFIAAMFAKPIACTLPATLLLLEYLECGRISLRPLYAIVPITIIAGMLAILFMYLEHSHVGASGPDFAFSAAARVLIAGRATVFYVVKMVAPVSLLAVYPRWAIDATDPLQYVYPLVVVVVVGVLFALRRRIGRGPFVLALMFVVILSPALGFINFFPMLYSFVSDHYAYLALAPFLVLVVMAMHAAAHRFAAAAENKLQIAVAIVAAMVLLPLTFVQASYWQTETSLWEHTVAGNPDSWVAHANLALAYRKENDRFEDCIRQARIALEKRPQNAASWANIGIAELQLNRPDRAVAALTQGLALRDNDAISWANLALAYMRLNDFNNATEAGRHAAQLDPRSGQTWLILAASYLQLQQFDRAEEAARKAVECAPTNPLAHANLAQALQHQSKFKAAADEYQATLSLMQENPAIRLQFARCLAASGNRDAAIQQYRQILAEAPEFQTARQDLDGLLRQSP